MSVKNDILAALQNGPLVLQGIHVATGAKKKTLQSKLWDLRQEKKIWRSEEGFFSLVEVDVNPNGSAPQVDEQPEEEEGQPADGPVEQEGPVDQDVPGPQAREVREAPSTVTSPRQAARATISGDEDRFKALLKDCGVVKAIDTINDTFFRLDTDDIRNLLDVLDDAKAFVNPQQKKLIVRYWLGYMDTGELSPEVAARLGREQEKGKPGEPESQMIDLGLGWKVERDKYGDYVAKPGGELKTYTEALRWATTMNATRPVEEEEEEEDGQPRGRRRSGGGASMISILLKAVIDRKSDPGVDDRIQRLQEQLDQEREARQDDRFARLEGLLAQATSGPMDPVAELVRQKEQLVALGLVPTAQPSQITDGSPTVQIIKETGDKVDKNVNRLVGIIERLALRGHNELTPVGHAASEPEQEERAGELLDQINQGTRSRELAQGLWPSRRRGV